MSGGQGPGAPETQQDYDTKIAALAQTITSMAPDVIGVQEVGSPEAFGDLVDKLGAGWHALLAHPSTEGGNHPIRVGAIARVELEVVEEITDYAPQVAPVQVADDGSTSTKLSRPILHVRADLDGAALDRDWDTRSEVVAAAPGREFAWEVAGGLVRWGYEMAPDGEGTRLTQRWTFPPAGRDALREKFGEDGVTLRTDDPHQSIPRTLAAIKKVVEGSPVP